MPRLLFAALALSALAPLAHAQPDSTLTADARALLFQVRPLIDLDAYDGATVSLKWHQSETRARRLGLTVSGRANTGTVRGAFDGDDRPRQDDGVGALQLRASLLFLTYREPRTAIRLYHGVGPVATVAFDRIEQTTQIPPDASGATGSSTQTRTFTAAAAGVGGAVGVEWVVHPAIGLTAEYGSSLVATYERNAQSRVTESGSGSDPIEDSQVQDRLGVTFGTGGARLGLSVYF